MKICIYCGSPVEDDFQFCNTCGKGFSPQEHEKKYSFFGTLVKILLYVLSFFVVQIGVSLIASISVIAAVTLRSEGESYEAITNEASQILNNSSVVLSLISNAIFIAAISIFFTLRRKNVLKEIRFSKFPLWMIPLSAVFGYCANPIISIVSALIPWPEEIVNYYNSSTESLLGGSLPITVIAISIVTGIVEEFLFRGIVITRMRRIFNAGISIVLSSLIFAAVHLNPISFMGIFIFAMFLGILFRKSGSVIPCMIAHAAFNLFAILGYPSENVSFILVFLLICILVCIATGYFLFTKDDSPE